MDKAQCFWSARQFGAVGFEPGLFQGIFIALGFKAFVKIVFHCTTLPQPGQPFSNKTLISTWLCVLCILLFSVFVRVCVSIFTISLCIGCNVFQIIFCGRHMFCSMSAMMCSFACCGRFSHNILQTEAEELSGFTNRAYNLRSQAEGYMRGVKPDNSECRGL